MTGGLHVVAEHLATMAEEVGISINLSMTHLVAFQRRLPEFSINEKIISWEGDTYLGVRIAGNLSPKITVQGCA